jgi:hypothetical protein
MKGVKILGGHKDEGVGFIFIKYQSFKVMYPPFSKVLMLVVCLFSPKNLRFTRYRGFTIYDYTCVPTKFHILFWDFEVTYPPFPIVLILMVCLHFPNYSPFERYKNLKVSWGWINEQVKAKNELIVSRLEVIYAPLFIVKRKFTITYTIIMLC